MVEIIAIVRPNKTAATKQALLEIGYPAFTCIKVTGRGKKPVNASIAGDSLLRTKLLAKRFFVIEAEDEAEKTVVEKLMEVNCTGAPGDGKIFVVPVDNSYSVRTGNKDSD